MIERYDIGGEYGVYLEDGIYSGDWCKSSDVTRIEHRHERMEDAILEVCTQMQIDNIKRYMGE
jgi:hypothetical protein